MFVILPFAKVTLSLGAAAEWGLIVDGHCEVALMWALPLMLLGYLVSVHSRRGERGERGP